MHVNKRMLVVFSVVLSLFDTLIFQLYHYCLWCSLASMWPYATVTVSIGYYHLIVQCVRYRYFCTPCAHDHDLKKPPCFSSGHTPVTILLTFLGRQRRPLYCFYFHRKCPERPERCQYIYVYIYIYICQQHGGLLGGSRSR